MAGFENYEEATRKIEHEIERMGVALGIDWSDEAQVRELAREALEHSQDRIHQLQPTRTTSNWARRSRCSASPA